MIIVIFVVAMLCLIAVLAPMVMISNKKHLMLMIQRSHEYKLDRKRGNYPDPDLMISDLIELKSKIVADKKAIEKADDIYKAALSFTQGI